MHAPRARHSTAFPALIFSIVVALVACDGAGPIMPEGRAPAQAPAPDVARDLRGGERSTAALRSAGGATGDVAAADIDVLAEVVQPSGSASAFSITLPSSDTAATVGYAFEVVNTGGGGAARFELLNTSGPPNQHALYAVTNGRGNAVDALARRGIAVHGKNNNTGRAGKFENASAANTNVALEALTVGTGRALLANQAGPSGDIAAFQQGGVDVATVDHVGRGTFNGLTSHLTGGTGPAGSFQIANNANGFNALSGTTSGFGAAVRGTTTGTSRAGYFDVNNSGNSSEAVYGTTNGTGTAMFANQSGPSASATALKARATGSGAAANFEIANVGNSSAVVTAITDGTGDVMRVDHRGASGNVAVFLSAMANVARIDKTGKGFFNGGTQASGADVAEAFAVVGSARAYEPGDVLVIAKNARRRVEKSADAYSTRVAGVYATKPGMLLTERGIDAAMDDLVPMGVIGVLPTKVSGEGGSIEAGDLLVTASTPGHAMRADPDRIRFGTVLGKALEPFDGRGTGRILVLVSLK